jgi:predicted enzyme related to lactoylglutathione lyase
VIKGIKFASIPVDDQDRALAFYTEKLGFTVATDQPLGEGQRWIELRIPGADTRLVLYTPQGWEDRVGGFSNVAFWADDVQKTYERLAARGVEFTMPPKTEHWGTSSVFKDSEGNQLALGSK